MRQLRRTALIALAGALAAAATAGAGGGSRQSASLLFTTSEPGAPSGIKVRIDYVNPDDPEAKPPAVRSVLEAFARRARFDTSVPGLCQASDAELMALGAGACAADSRVGTGVITLDTGLPGPARIVTADITFLNNTDELIFVNTVRGAGARVVVRAEVRRRKLISEAPFIPGTLPDGTAIDTVKVDVPAIAGTDGTAYLTTPDLCRKRGFWRNRIDVTYADDVTQTVVSRSPCEPNRPR